MGFLVRRCLSSRLEAPFFFRLFHVRFAVDDDDEGWYVKWNNFILFLLEGWKQRFVCSGPRVISVMCGILKNKMTTWRTRSELLWAGKLSRHGSKRAEVDSSTRETPVRSSSKGSKLLRTLEFPQGTARRSRGPKRLLLVIGLWAGNLPSPIVSREVLKKSESRAD